MLLTVTSNWEKLHIDNTRLRTAAVPVSTLDEVHWPALVNPLSTDVPALIVVSKSILYLQSRYSR